MSAVTKRKPDSIKSGNDAADLEDKNDVERRGLTLDLNGFIKEHPYIGCEKQCCCLF